MNKFALAVESLTKVYSSHKTKKHNKALNELSFSVLNKFKKETAKFLDFSDNSIENMFMSKKNYGIRPQLYDKQQNKLVDDFISIETKNSMHVLNAISPAFTSGFELADLIINKSRIV